MRVPLAWLRAYCDPALSTDELADRLASVGLQAERIDRIGVGSADGFVVGKVLSAERHPDADRLTVCLVDDGSREQRQIVCGAPNVAAGQTVAVARPGSVMPDGTRLGEAKLRGVKSSGMILAEDEVGISHDHAETMVLRDDLAPGVPLNEALVIEDEVFDLEVNPNRPDCLAVYGVAREVHAFSGAPLEPEPPDVDSSGDEQISIEIDPEICLRFTARVFEDVQIGPSPLWLKQRLTAAGQRPINNVVDITNYVMLATGQPLHAFDLDKVRGGKIVVRRAQDGEKITTLDDVERTLDTEMAVVCDAEGPSGIGGVMGGQISEVSDDTTRVLMEAATWVGPNILSTSKKLMLRSEASTRFEKQLHPDFALAGQRLAARLMVELCGARLVSGTIDVYPNPAEQRRVRLRYPRIEKLLGQRIPEEQVIELLSRLGFELEEATAEHGPVWDLVVPYWRDGDVQREADAIEEVARVYGLDNIPATLPARRQAVGRLTFEQRLRRRVEDALRDRGYSETISWSFTSAATMEALRLGDVPLLRLSNPLSEDQSVMRPLLLPGVLDAARHNAAHGRPEVALFESAHAYRVAGPLSSNGARPERGTTPAAERHNLAAYVTNDFLALKAVLGALLDIVGVEWWVEPGERPFLHPGRTATVLAGDERKLGWIGELHPLVARAWDLGGGSAFEIDLDLLAEIAPEVRPFEPVSTFPAVIQDIAVVVAEDVSAAEVEMAVREGAGDLLERLSLFDVYRGEQVGEGNKSLALRLEFRAPDRTLTDEEVAERRAAVERHLAEIGGKLRA
jgi:phenylalanyl-tRNA synthetase beta chain